MPEWSEVNKMTETRDVNGLNKLLGNDKNPFHRHTALVALRDIADPSSFAALYKSLQYQRIEPAALIAFFGRVELVPPSAASVSTRLEYEVATAALGKIGFPPKQINQKAMSRIKKQEWADCIALGEKAVEALTEVLNSADPATRRCAAGALGQIGAAKSSSNLFVPAIGRLIERLYDEAWDVRQAAAWALGQIGNPAAAFALSVVWVNDDNAAVCKDAAASLRQIGEPAIMPLILRLGNRRPFFSLGQPPYEADRFDCAAQGLLLLDTAGTSVVNLLIKAFTAQPPGKRSKGVADALKLFYHEAVLDETLRADIRAFQGSLIEERFGVGYEDSHGGGHGIELSPDINFEL